MDFKDSSIYKEVISDNKTLPIAYYLDSGIIISETNVDYIIEIEIMKIKEKIKIVGRQPQFDNLENVIKKMYKEKIGSEYLIIEYAYLNKENIDIAYPIIEASENFYGWIL